MSSPAETEAPTDHPTFYQTGGTLPADAASYAEREADRALFDALSNGEFCYLLNARQMGKSSLCIRVRRQLEASGVRTAYLELSAVGGSSVEPAVWYATLLNALGRELGLHREFAQYRRDRAEMSPVSWVFSALEEVALARMETPLVVFLDEIDAVRSLSFSADEFFGALRALYNRRAEVAALRRLTFCLVGSATQADLVSDTRLSPFNIGRQIDLRDFTRAELQPLALGLNGNGRDGTALLDRIFHWTNGHPFLTQSICAGVAAIPALRTPDAVDRLIAETYFTASARRGNVHLADVANRMLTRKTGEIDPADDRQKADILALYESILRGKKPVSDDETNPLVSLLKLSGIVRVENGILRVRNRLYERVFDGNWITESRPDAETRRLRAAATRGRWQVGVMAAGVIAVMSLLLGFAVVKSNEAEARRQDAVEATRKADTAASRERNQRQIAEGETSRANREKANAEQAAKDTQLALLREKAAKKREADARKQSDKNAELAGKNAQIARNNATTASNAAARADREAALAKRFNYISNINLAQREIEANNYGRAIEILSDPAVARFPMAGYERLYLNDLLHLARRTLTGHSKYVTSVCFSPDGRRILTGSNDKTARLWDATTGKELITLKGHSDSVNSVCFSPDGRRILTGSDDKTARLWDCVTGKELLTLKGHNAAVYSVCFSPDGNRIACGCADKVVRVWDSKTGKELITLKGHSPAYTIITSDGKTMESAWGIRSLAFSPDGKRIVTLNNDSTASLWDSATGTELLPIFIAPADPFGIDAVAFSPDGKKIVTGSFSGIVRVWDSETRKQLFTLKGHTNAVPSVCFSPDGRRILTGSSDKTARLWDAVTGDELLTMGHTDRVSSVCFSPDGKRILTGSDDKMARLWDTVIDRQLLTPTDYMVTSICFSPDGRRILTGRLDTTARLQDSATGKELLTLKGHTDRVSSVCFSPDGRQILTGSDDRTARLWDSKKGKELLTLKRHTGPVTSVCFSPDGRQILTGSGDKTVRLWDATTAKELITFKGVNSQIASVCFSSDGKQIRTVSLDSTIRIWDISTGKEIPCFKGHPYQVSSACFSPDGRQVLTGSADKTARLWDAKTGMVLLTLKGHTDGVSSVCFSPDGKRILTGSADRTARLWDFVTGKELITFKGATNGITSVCFSPDGRQALTSFFNSLRIWRRMTDAQTDYFVQNDLGSQAHIARCAFYSRLYPESAQAFGRMAKLANVPQDSPDRLPILLINSKTEAYRTACHTPIVTLPPKPTADTIAAVVFACSFAPLVPADGERLQQAVEQALAADPKNARLLRRLAMVQIRSGQREKALENLDRSEAIEANDFNALWRSLALAQLGQIKEAEEALDRFHGEQAATLKQGQREDWQVTLAYLLLEREIKQLLAAKENQ